MTPADETTEEGKASRMMRRAILHELLQPFDPDPPPPACKLQAYPILLSGRIPSGDAPAIGKSFAEGTAADLRSSSAIIGSVANASHKPLKSVGHGCLIFRGLARNDN